MFIKDFELGDLVEIVNLSPSDRRVLAGTSRSIAKGEQGIVTEMYLTDFRVQCGSNGLMQWEANIRPDEVRLVARLGREEATRRLFSKTQKSAAIAAIEFALKTDEGLEFLRCWHQGDFQAIRKEWPEAPEAVFIGADPLHKASVQGGSILAADVTLDDETMTIEADQVHHALHCLGGELTPGRQFDVTIKLRAMTAAEFAALPEWQ